MAYSTKTKEEAKHFIQASLSIQPKLRESVLTTFTINYHPEHDQEMKWVLEYATNFGNQLSLTLGSD
jgi:hypothetical protein